MEGADLPGVAEEDLPGVAEEVLQSPVWGWLLRGFVVSWLGVVYGSPTVLAVCRVILVVHRCLRLG